MDSYPGGDLLDAEIALDQERARVLAAQATKWTKVNAPGGSTGSTRGVYTSYDSGHHVLYSSNFSVGLWRLGTM